MNIARIKSAGSKTKRGSFVVMTGWLLTLGVIGAAWACTVSPSLSVEPGFSTPGSLVTIQGAFIPIGAKTGQASEAGPVEIRWNGSDGPLLASSEASSKPVPDGTNLSVPVTVPSQARPGVYYLVAVQRDASGNVIAKAAETFEVRSAGSSVSGASQRAVSGDLWSGLAGNTGRISAAESEVRAAASSGYLAVGISLAGISALALALGAGTLASRKRKIQRSR